MRCSDCKFYKTEECKLKPEAEYFVAEMFDCFELDSNKKASIAKQDYTPPDLADEDRNWGGTLLLIGIIGTIISVIVVIYGITGGPYLEEPPADGYVAFGGGILFLISIVLAIVGAIWWFLDWVEKRGSTSDDKPVKKLRL